MPSGFASSKDTQLKLNPIDDKKTVVAHLESAAYPVEDAKIPAKLNLFSQSTYI
jgi:hypothetical protein